MMKMRLGSAGLFVALCIAIVEPANAQIDGEYAGKNSDGLSVEIVVYKDSKGNAFLTFVQEAAYFYCDGKLLVTPGPVGPSGGIAAYGAAILMEVPIKNGQVRFAGRSNDLSAITGAMSFDGQKIVGHLSAYAALYAGTMQPPNDPEAKSCKTKSLQFRAEYANPVP